MGTKSISLGRLQGGRVSTFAARITWVVHTHQCICQLSSPWPSTAELLRLPGPAGPPRPTWERGPVLLCVPSARLHLCLSAAPHLQGGCVSWDSRAVVMQ